MRAIKLLSLCLFLPLAAWSGTYTTSFSGTENPISESSQWINGLATGLDWSNVRKTPGLAFGTQSGNEANDNDSTALLTGTWGVTQTVTAVVALNNSGNTAAAEEVELRVLSSLSANSCTGYEILFSSLSGNRYVQIVRWNGALDNFTLLDARTAGVVNGDTVKATTDGAGKITCYTNNVEVFHVTDTTYTSGKPGLGFYLKLNGGSGANANFGFSSFTATDGLTAAATNFVQGRVGVAGKVTFVIH